MSSNWCSIHLRPHRATSVCVLCLQDAQDRAQEVVQDAYDHVCVGCGRHEQEHEPLHTVGYRRVPMWFHVPWDAQDAPVRTAYFMVHERWCPDCRQLKLPLVAPRALVS